MGHVRDDMSHTKTPVRAELIKQLALVGVIAAIGIWQHHFVIQSASADVYIFALLFGAAFFGFYNTIRGTHALKNEFIALEALKEVHADARREAAEPADHTRLVTERFDVPSTIYDAPKALGTAHNLIYAELLRNGTLSIPPATMQVLVSDLETKLDERQGMAHYMGALMVLLGLLGTFIGLMHTLESVGGILGSLDLSGNGGTEAIASLIESLKKPLEGMSTGFGASLFGLIGSLVIGVLSKFDSKVAHHLQHDFETWLRSTVQIEAARQNGADTYSAGEADMTLSNNWRTVLQVARNTVLATSRLASRQGELAESFSAFRQQFSERDHVWAQHFARVASLLESQNLTQEQSRAGQELLRASFHELAGQINSSLGTGTRILDGRLADNRVLLEQSIARADRLEDVFGLLSDRFMETNAFLQSIDRKLSQPPEDSDKKIDRTDLLIADLEHLIAAMRLRTEDIVSVRRLAQMLKRRDGANAVDESVKGAA